MTRWKRILSARPSLQCALSPVAQPANIDLGPGAGSGVTGRPAPRPYTATERYLIALSIGRATGGA